MKTYNLFHLYIITTILLLLVIELYHFISINELHHFSLYPHDQNPKSASDRNVTDGNVRSGKVVPML